MLVFGKAKVVMASLTSVFVVLLGSLLCCGRLGYISSRAINHVEALSLSGHQPLTDFQQSSSFDKRRRYRLIPFDTATKLADSEKGESEEEVAFRMKRLMGLFRCSGWGPSCSWSDWSEPTMRSEQRSTAVGLHRGEKNPSTRLVNIKTTARNRRPTTKFQPFFTLTSGRIAQRSLLFCLE